MSRVRATVRFQGRVQGVSFRYFTLKTAQEAGLRGWVRNLPEGDVEALFEGEESAVRQALEICRKGPPAAHVTDVLIDWERSSDEFKIFEIRY